MLIASAAAVNVKHAEADRLARGEPALDEEDHIGIAAKRIKDREPVAEAYLFSGQLLPAVMERGVSEPELKPYWYGFFRHTLEQYGDTPDAHNIWNNMLDLSTIEPGVPDGTFQIILAGRDLARRHHEEELAKKTGTNG